MLSLNVHVRQVLGEWQVSAILVESFGESISPEVSTDAYTMPLTEREWDSDALTATLSALSRWSGRAIDGQHGNRKG